MRISGRVARASVVAFVTLAVVYTSVNCPRCRRRVMDVPGEPLVKIRVIGSVQKPSGKGRTLACQKCHSVLEVIEHGP